MKTPLLILFLILSPRLWAQYTGGSGQGYAMSATLLNQTLPVQWQEFRAEQEDGEIVLHWSTAAELNNDFFEIQHSDNGIVFTPIGSVRGNGTTRSISHYSYRDAYPVLGTNFYRLKQVDFDGKFEYSPALTVVYADNDELALHLYPNPVRTTLHIMLPFPARGYLSIYNSAGKKVFGRDLGESREERIDVSDLKQGFYALVCRLGALSLSSKFAVE